MTDDTNIFRSVYCHGVADGLVSMARRDRKEEERKAIKAEADRLTKAKTEEDAARKAELERLEGPVAPASHDGEETEVKPESTTDTSIPEDTAIKVEAPDEKRGVKMEEVPDEDELRRRAQSMPRPLSPDMWYYGLHHNPGTDSDGDSDSDEDVPDYFGRDHERRHDADFVEGDEVDTLLDLESAEPKVKVKPEPADEVMLQARVSPARDLTPDPAPVKAESDDIEPSWHSGGQLIQFRNDAEKIAEEFLKSQKDEDGKPVKLGKGRPTAGANIKDAAGRKAYRKGALMHQLIVDSLHSHPLH